jgi:hypothetical protein
MHRIAEASVHAFPNDLVAMLMETEGRRTRSRELNGPARRRSTRRLGPDAPRSSVVTARLRSGMFSLRVGAQWQR